MLQGQPGQIMQVSHVHSHAHTSAHTERDLPISCDWIVPSSGNGTCMTLEGLALYTYNSYKNLAGYTYTSPWDAK